MPQPTADTPNYGLTRVGRGEQLNKNGYRALDGDRTTIDRLFNALANHDHSNEDRLSGPANGPVLIANSTGGRLLPGKTYYYRISFLDRWGLETESSPEVSVTTPGSVTPPTPPTVQAEATSGTIGTGNYSYVITAAASDGGETMASNPSSVQIHSGSTNRIRLDLPPLPAGTIEHRIYRAKPGQNKYYLLEVTDQSTFYDTGLNEDRSVTLPTRNTTNARNSVDIQVPGGSLPDGAFGWKIYRSDDSGRYTGFNLVHHVVETADEIGGEITTVWTDTGTALLQGQPLNKPATIGTGSAVDLDKAQGKLKMENLPRGSGVWQGTILGTVGEQTYSKTRIPRDIIPTRLTAFFGTGPTFFDTATPDERLYIRISDSAATPNFVELELTPADNGEQYFVKDFPLTEGATHDAEQGARSDNGLVPIVNDDTAGDGQAVQINDQDEWVEYTLGVLDIGKYTTYANIRAPFIDGATPTGPADDIEISVWRKDTNSLVVSSTITVDSFNYVEYVGPEFEAVDGVPYAIRVTKKLVDAVSYNIDTLRYQAELVTLLKGDISLETVRGNPDAGSDLGSDVQVSLWF